MDYINGGARDIGRRKEVRFLSYLQGIPFVHAYMHASIRAHVCAFVHVCVRARCVRRPFRCRGVAHLKADELG